MHGIDYGHWSTRTVGDFNPVDYHSFVYLITIGQYTYYGKKKLHVKADKPPIEYKRKTFKQSDWRKYKSSSATVKQMILDTTESVKYEILALTRSESETLLLEFKFITANLNDPNLLNKSLALPMLGIDQYRKYY